MSREAVNKMTTEITDSNFEQTISQTKTVMVDFWATWCGPCRALAPTIEELAKEYEGRILIGKMEVDQNPKTTDEYQVFSIPTMVLFKDGKEVDRLIGLMPASRIRDHLSMLL